MEKEKFKLTNQRMIILNFIKGNYTHPSVEQVYNYAITKLPRISKKTVYNNLSFLQKKGLINEIRIGNVLRYEPKLDAHAHLICNKCGKIQDIKTSKIYEYTKKMSKDIKDFKVKSFEINFYGICKKCREE